MKTFHFLINNKKVVLISILTFAFFLRFFQLSVNPPSLTWDEAAWGINAYSLSISGKDEFGQLLPISYLESFGDFKPPLYAYLSVVPVWVFGVNEFSIRFTSAFLGFLTVLVTYFLAREIFEGVKYRESIAVVAAFLLAISPWHILLSRAAFEANVATFFIVLATTIFLIATKNDKNVKYLIFSLIFYVCALYTFNTSRVFLPLFVLFLFLLRRNIMFRNWKKVILSLVVPVVISLPLLFFMVTPQAKLRFEEVNIFSDISVIERTNQEIENAGSSTVSRFIYNRRFAYAVEYLNHYLDNFNPKFLFITGDGNPKFSIQDVGQLYLWELPFLIIGAVMVFRKKEGLWVILPVWILLGIIPAATARETPHALRIETIVPTFQIITAYGVIIFWIYISQVVKNNYVKKCIYVLFASVIIFSVVYFSHNYFYHYPRIYAAEWQYGYKDAINFTEKNKDLYEKIYFTQDFGRPYAYVMLYGNYPIGVLQNDSDVEKEALGFVHVNRLSKYYFPKVLPDLQERFLYVNTPGKVPPQAKVLKTIYFPDGKPSLVIYEK